MKESTGSSRLGKKVDSMINKIEERLKLIETEIDGELSQHLDADGSVILFFWLLLPLALVLGLS